MFIDIEKAYDRVPWQEVWRCLREQGVPEKYVRLVKDMYEDARTQVKTSIGLAGKITVRVGLYQGSSLSPYLFYMILVMMGRASKSSPLVYAVCRRYRAVQHNKRPCRKEALGMEKSNTGTRIED